MPDLPQELRGPALAMLPRVVDQLGFLYVDMARVEMDDNGVCALIVTEEYGEERTYLPTAAIAAVLLGPGTSITQPAATQLMRDGASLLYTGQGAVRCYGGMTHNDLTTKWLHKQASIWADDESRIEAARWLYARRFGDPELAEGKSLEQLRGMEGYRVKEAYKLEARRHGATFKRSLLEEDYDSLDPINKGLNAANQVLYGITHSAILAMGASPALGFIHSGSQRSFVYDIADLYKLTLSVPLAFTLRHTNNVDAAVRFQFRRRYKALRMAKTIVNDIQGVLTAGEEWDEEVAEDGADLGVTYLWDPERGALPAKRNYAG